MTYGARAGRLQWPRRGRSRRRRNRGRTYLAVMPCVLGYLCPSFFLPCSFGILLYSCFYSFLIALSFLLATFFTLFSFIRFIFDLGWCLYNIAVPVLPSVCVKEHENPWTDYNTWCWGILLEFVDSFRFSRRSAWVSAHFSSEIRYLSEIKMSRTKVV
jgi:hypothetical protein